MFYNDMEDENLKPQLLKAQLKNLKHGGGGGLMHQPICQFYTFFSWECLFNANQINFFHRRLHQGDQAL
jgi:hypothetical protein